MAPLDDASCGGSAIRNPLTTLREQDNVDRSLHQNKLRPNSNNGLGQTMRSRPQEPTLDFQKAFDAFENQDAALRLVELRGRDCQQEQDHMIYDRVWAAAVDERPFAGQYAEIDLILQQHADLGRREMKHESGKLVARTKSHADEIEIGSPLQQEKQPLSPEPSVPTYPSYVHLSQETTTDISHFQAWGDFVEPVLACFASEQFSEKWEPALHYLDVYRIAVQDNLPEVRDGALQMLTAKDIKMPDVNEGLRRGAIKIHTLRQPMSLSEYNQVLPVQVQLDPFNTISDEAKPLLSEPRDAEATGSVPKHKSPAARLMVEWKRTQIEAVPNLSPQNAKISESSSDTVITNADFDALYTARPATLSLNSYTQFTPSNQLSTPPLEDPKITSTAEQLANERRRLNKANELETPCLEARTKRYLDRIRRRAIQYAHFLLGAPTEQEVVNEMRVALRRVVRLEEGGISAEELAVARRAMREIGMLVPGEEEAGVDLEELAWTPGISMREKSMREKTAQRKHKRRSQAKNIPMSKAEQESHIADLERQSRSKASDSHQEAGRTILYAHGSECEAAQDSHVEENPAQAPPSVITHHSIMFRFLDKLYASTDHKNSQDADVSPKDRDPECVLLRQPVLLRHALSVLKMEDNEELGVLRDKYGKFHEELHSALEAVRQEYEEVVENEHGDWMLRLREGMKMKAKL